jgi:hypothetical protein
MALALSPVEATPTRATVPRAVLQGLAVKMQIVKQVIEGRMPLLEAAARFQAVTRQASVENALNAPPAATDNEVMARSVIGWVELVLRDRPEQADVISARLESELQSHIQRFGKVLLPQAG